RLPQLDEAGGRRHEPTRTAEGEPPLRPGRRHGDVPSFVDLAEDVAVGDEDVFEEDLGKTLVAVEAPEAPDGDAVGIEWHQEVRHPAVALCLGIAAEKPEQMRAEGAAGRPRLLTGEAPTAVIAASDGLDTGQVAAGVGLRPSLAPE